MTPQQFIQTWRRKVVVTKDCDLELFFGKRVPWQR